MEVEVTITRILKSYASPTLPFDCRICLGNMIHLFRIERQYYNRINILGAVIFIAMGEILIRRKENISNLHDIYCTYYFKSEIPRDNLD